MEGLIKMLDQSRTANAIKQVEEGTDVDWNRVGLLQTLDVARAGEIFAVELLKAEGEADERSGVPQEER